MTLQKSLFDAVCFAKVDFMAYAMYYYPQFTHGHIKPIGVYI